MRTILLPYTPSEAVRRLLHDVRAMVRHRVARNLVLRGHARLYGAPLPMSVRASVAKRAQVTPRDLTAAVVKLHAGKDAVAQKTMKSPTDRE